MGFPTCATCSGEDKQEDAITGLVRGHAYTLLDARISKGAPFVRLRNPWGRGRWRGADAAGGSPSSPRSQARDADEGNGVFWMKYSDFLQEFSNVDVCRVREGHTSECVEVQPSLGPGSTKMAFLRLSAKIAGEVTISALQPQSRHGRTRSSSSKSTPREYDSTGITLIALSGVPEIVAMSQFNSRQEVPLEVTLKAGVEYLVVLRSTPRPSENTPSACNICTYAPHPLGLKVSSQTDYGVLFSCLERKALQNGDILWQEGSAFVRCWTSENG